MKKVGRKNWVQISAKKKVGFKMSLLRMVSFVTMKKKRSSCKKVTKVIWLFFGSTTKKKLGISESQNRKMSSFNELKSNLFWKLISCRIFKGHIHIHFVSSFFYVRAQCLAHKWPQLDQVPAIKPSMAVTPFPCRIWMKFKPGFVNHNIEHYFMDNLT